MADFNFIENSIRTVDSSDRLLSSRYLPKSVDLNSSAPIKVGKRTLSSVVLIPNNTTATFASSLVPTPFNPTFIAMDYAIFLNSTSDPVANLIPGGTSVTEANFRIFGPMEYRRDFSGSVAGTKVYCSRVGISNTSGSSQSIIVVRTYKYLINDGGEI